MSIDFSTLICYATCKIDLLSALDGHRWDKKPLKNRETVGPIVGTIMEMFRQSSMMVTHAFMVWKGSFNVNQLSEKDREFRGSCLGAQTNRRCYIFKDCKQASSI